MYVISCILHRYRWQIWCLPSQQVKWSEQKQGRGINQAQVLLYYKIHFTMQILHLLDHVERKVPKYKNHKLRERKVKTLTRNSRDHQRTGTHKHTKTVSRYFDRHDRDYQSEESKCLWTHHKDGITRKVIKGATRGLREGWMKGNYLRLMPGLSLEDRTNW